MPRQLPPVASMLGMLRLACAFLWLRHDVAGAWMPPLKRPGIIGCSPPWQLHGSSSPLDLLMEMDVIIYSLKGDDGTRRIGAVQEGRIALLSAWTLQPAFGESVELLVDEHDMMGYPPEQVTIHSIIPESQLSYGSRQVGGGKGPGNPHGEESERLYYVEQQLLHDVTIPVKPELEITW